MLKLRICVLALGLFLVPGNHRSIEQTSQGSRSPAPVIDSFDGIGAGFEGPHGVYAGRNPSDNSLAVGPDHIVQTVNSRLAVFSKKGRHFEKTGTVLYGPAPTNTIFAEFGGMCEARNNGDAVVRYDQLSGRWLLVMPIFGRIPSTEVQGRPPVSEPAPPGQLAAPGQAASPGKAAAPPAMPPPLPPPPQGRGQGRGQPASPGQPSPPPPPGTYGMCYAVSVGDDPLGPYNRYAFERPLFPDYPRPAVWPDGYYVPTSTGDEVIQKHACVADRNSMLKGLPATEQCTVIDGVNFLNNADVDGPIGPPPGTPNIMMAAGGTQLKGDFDDEELYAWSYHVDWARPSNTKLTGPMKIPVAPYHYLCNGQLTSCVPQPGTERKLDAQGDKLMQRLVYRNVKGHESIVALHSVDTAAGGGGVRWYEFRLDRQRRLEVYQQGTYAPDRFYRWMGSIGMDRDGNIAIGYSFGGDPHFAGQRFTGRLFSDPRGQMTLRETVLVEGEAAQTTTVRWEDYATMTMDPSDDCTFWYVGDYFKKDAATYSTRIGSFRLPGCR